MNQRALLFSLGETTFTLPAETCREVFSPHALLPLPAAHPTLIGLTEVRGRAVPLVNLNALHAGHGPAADASSPHLLLPPLALLLEVQGELLALPVDQMLGISATKFLPGARDKLFEATRIQGRDAQYICPAVMLGTLQTRTVQARPFQN